MPGSSLPSRYSRDAPPPVEMWPNWSSRKPSWRTAAAESPPPTTVSAPFSVTSTSASARRRVPAANGAISNAPIGPFQNTVRVSASFSAYSSADLGPMSSPMRSAGIASAATVTVSVSAENSRPHTTSTGRTISTPVSSARRR